MKKQVFLWGGALVVGALLGMLGVAWLDHLMNFVATIYSRLFQLLAVPTIVLAVITTLASFGKQRETRRIFVRTITYTLLTTFAAALVGMLLYIAIAPGNLSLGANPSTTAEQTAAVESLAADTPTSYSDHILSVIPNNIVRPFLEGNALTLILLAFVIGIGISRMPESERKDVLVKGLQGLQELLFMLIRWLIWTLPVGIVAFAAQLSAQVTAGVVIDSLGKYVAVIIGGINPLKTFSAMSPAVLMALFTKSSAATLPVTMESAEKRNGVSPRVARFVLPICTTINMNGCAAFILVTSLFVMQNSGMAITLPTMILWLFIAVFSAIGNAGVPMGCYFLTLSLMTGIGGDIAIMGIILPIYTIIDMLETAENVWSDSCVCAMTDRDLRTSQE